LRSAEIEEQRKALLTPSPTDTRSERTEKRAASKSVAQVLAQEKEETEKEIEKLNLAAPAALQSLVSPSEAEAEQTTILRPPSGAFARVAGGRRTEQVKRKDRGVKRSLSAIPKDDAFHAFCELVVNGDTGEEEEIPEDLQGAAKKVHKLTHVWPTPDEMNLIGAHISKARDKYGCSESQKARDVEEILKDDFFGMWRGRGRRICMCV
jgi:hypothetical protein